MNAAVLGANGFLGRNLASELLKSGFKVWAFYRNAHERIPAGCVKADVRNLDLETVFDCLFVSIGNYALSEEQFTEQRSFLGLALKKLRFKKVVYASSVFVEGATLYGNAKAAEERLVSACERFSIVRLTYLYGSGMGRDSLIPKLCQQAKRDKKILIYGDGSRRQDYLHVSDAVSLLLKSAQKSENAVFLGATGESIANKDLASEIAKSIPDVQVEFAGTDSTPSFVYDIENTKRHVDWAPQIPFVEGLQKYIKDDLAYL